MYKRAPVSSPILNPSSSNRNASTRRWRCFVPPMRQSDSPARVGGVSNRPADPKSAIRLFGWAVEQEIIAASPTLGLKAPAVKEKPRDRILSDDELRSVWRAAEQIGTPY